MNAVTAETGKASFAVRRTQKVRVRCGMAGQAFGIDLLGRGLFKAEDFGDVTAAFDMGSAGAVATLAGNAVARVFEGETRMRIAGEAFGDVGVASGAGAFANISGRCTFRSWLRYRLLRRSCGKHRSRTKCANRQERRRAE